MTKNIEGKGYGWGRRGGYGPYGYGWPPPAQPYPPQPYSPPPMGEFRRIAAATEGYRGLDDIISPVLGRAPTFTIIELEKGEVKDVRTIPNPAAYAPRGAGGYAIEILAREGVEAVLAGGSGGWAMQAAMSFGIILIPVPPGIPVGEALNNLISGRGEGVGYP